jgi:hypothetical protein
MAQSSEGGTSIVYLVASCGLPLAKRTKQTKSHSRSKTPLAIFKENPNN